MSSAMPAGAKDHHPGVSMWLYDDDGDDRRVDGENMPTPGEHQMLWVDLEEGHLEEAGEVWRHLDVADAVEALPTSTDQPSLTRQDGVMRLVVKGAGSGTRPGTIQCLVSQNWVVTIHDGEVNLVDEFNEPFDASTHLGSLDGPAFLSLLLDWHINGFFEEVQALQDDVDRLDEELLERSPREPELLQNLQRARSRVRMLRGALSKHREILARLAHPESDTALGADSAADYRRLEERLERAIDGVDTTREMIVGSFDIFMSRTAQATNEVMRRLTVVSVLLLPAGVLAGVMGMNFRVGLFDRPENFWVVIGVMVFLAAATIVVAKRRGWL